MNIKRSVLVFSVILSSVFSQATNILNDTIKVIESNIYKIEKVDSVYNINFGKKLGNNDIIGLGEATHGSKEIFLIKTDIIMSLIKNDGFNVVGFEAPFAESELINTYILTGQGNPRVILSRLDMWTWNTEEVLYLMERLKNYNKQQTDSQSKVMFFGFDINNYAGITNYLINNLNYVNDSLFIALKDSITKYAYARYDLMKKGNYSNPKKLTNKLCDDITNLMDYIDKNDFIKDELKYEQYSKLNIYLRYLQQFAIMHSDNKPFPNYRDSCMAENIRYYIKDNPNKKLILWAHNGHINKTSTTMGGYLNKWYNNLYYSLAITVLSGEYTAISDSGLTRKNILSKPVKNSYEYSFEKINSFAYFINISDVNKKYLSFFSRKEFREIGSIAHDYQFKSYNLVKEFNGLIIIKFSIGTNVLL